MLAPARCAAEVIGRLPDERHQRNGPATRVIVKIKRECDRDLLRRPEPNRKLKSNAI
jgi:hypothetical protein